MQNFKSLKIILTLLSLAVFIVCIIYYFLYKDIKSKNEHISLITNKVLFQSDEQNYLLSTQKVIQSISSDIDHINNSVIQKGGDVKFIEGLESLARRSGLSISIDSLTILDNPDLASSSIKTLQIRAKTSGSWFGNYKFLSELEAMPVKIRVNKFDIAKMDEEDVSNSPWQSTFEINVLKYD